MPERMSLRLNPVINKYNDYQGVAITPSTVNYGILNDVVNSRIQAKENAIIKQSGIKQKLGQIREQLHQDEETLSWFNDKSKDIENKINDALLIGNYNTAINVATQEAGNLADDAELNARIRTNAQYKEEYEKQRQRIGKGISQATFDWWVKNNPYKYENITDANGEIVGGEDWKSDFTPVNDLNLDELALRAAQLKKPDRGSKAESGNQSIDKTYSDTTTAWSNQWEKLDVNDIINNMDYILMTTPDGQRAMAQAFNVALSEKQKIIDEINKYPEGSNERRIKELELSRINEYFRDPNTGYTLNNDENGWKIYQARMLADNMIAKGLAYDWRNTSNSTKIENPLSSTVGHGGQVYDPETSTWVDKTIVLPGEEVKTEIDTENENKTAVESSNSSADALKQAEGERQTNEVASRRANSVMNRQHR